MAFPGACLTNVLKTEHLSSIPYHVYTFSTDPPGDNDLSLPSPPTSASLRRQRERILRRLEQAGRDHDLVVTALLPRLELWFYDVGRTTRSVADVVADGLEAAQSEGVDLPDQQGLRASFTGTFAASALEKERKATGPLSRRAAPTSAPPTSSSFDQSLLALKQANAEVAHANRALSATTASQLGTAVADALFPTPSDDRGNPVWVYQVFITAVVASLSYHLAKLYRYRPLNFRTLLNPEPSPVSLLRDPVRPRESSHIPLTTLYVYLTSSGTLVVRPAVAHHSGLTTLTTDTAAETDKDLSSTVDSRDVWLAPGGTIARYVGPEDDVGLDHQGSPTAASQSREDERELARQRLVAKRADALWKIDVAVWLNQKGIDLTEVNGSIEWVRVQVRQPADQPTDTATPRDHTAVQTILWPRSLSFVSAGPSSAADRIRLDGSDTEVDGMTWFLPNRERGAQDPMGFAQDWFRGRTERATILDRMRLAREAEAAAKEKAAASAVATANATLPTAPGSTRPMNPAEIQAASAVYPTPPDGVPPASAGGVASSDTGANAQRALGASTDGHPSPQNDALDMDLDLWNGPGENDAESGMRKQSSLSAFDLPSGADLDPTSGGNMYGDMDEDMFNETGVTEADFSFFDGPGGDDLFGGDADAGPDESSAVPEPGVDASMLEDETKPEPPPASIEPMMSESGVPGHDDSSPATLGHGPSRESVFSPDIKREGSALGSTPAVPAVTQNGFTMSPPLSPTQIMKSILPDTTETSLSQARTSPTTRRRKPSSFDPVAFNTVIEATTNKYDAPGPFWFSPIESPRVDRSSTRDGRARQSHIPRIGMPASGRKRPRVRRSSTAEDAGNADGHERSVPPRKRRSGSETDEEDRGHDRSDESDSDDSSDSSDMVRSPSMSTKRKRSSKDGHEAMTSSMDLLGLEPTDLSHEAPQDAPSLRQLGPDPSDWSLEGYCDAGVPGHDVMLNLVDREWIDTAQIVADQVVSDSLFQRKIRGQPGADGSIGEASCDQQITNAVEHLFPHITACTLLDYSAVEGIAPEPWAASARPSPQISLHLKRQQESCATTDTDVSIAAIAKVSPPHVSIQRGDSGMEILPPALNFWETFGFGPCGGSKDVTAFCVYPSGDGVGERIGGFLERVGSVYRGCRLGEHVRGELDGIDKGLVPVRAGACNAPLTLQRVMTAVKEACVALGNLLPNLSSRLQNIVIYMVNPFSHSGALVDLCAAFSALCQTYVSSPKLQQFEHINEVVLQVVPMGFIADEHFLAVPSQVDHTRLALQTYERCALTEGKTVEEFPCRESAPAVLLAPTIPKSIDFRLTPDPSSSVLQENRCLHVAYSRGLNDRWVSAAWTDNRGDLQNCTSYCRSMLSGSSASRSFDEVAKEIWETTMEMIQIKRVQWHIVVVKAGVFETDETDVWIALSTQTTQPSTTMSLFSAETAQHSAPLSLKVRLAEHEPEPGLDGTMDSAPPSSLPPAGSQLTPVSTPQPPSTQSPDQSGTNAATPTANAPTPGVRTPGGGETAMDTPGDGTSGGTEETHTTLVDLADDTWMVTLAHPLPTAPSVVEYRPALASGYLIRRGVSMMMPVEETGDEDEVVSVVNRGGGVGGGRGEVGEVMGLSLVYTSSLTHPPLPPPTLTSTSTGHLQSESQADGASASTPSTSTSNLNTSVTSTSTTASQSNNSTNATSSATHSGTRQANNASTALLREILVVYRGLATLARLKGVFLHSPPSTTSATTRTSFSSLSSSDPSLDPSTAGAGAGAGGQKALGGTGVRRAGGQGREDGVGGGGGVGDGPGEGFTLPWHIVAAMKAQEGLSRLM